MDALQSRLHTFTIVGGRVSVTELYGFVIALGRSGGDER